jgi:LysR family cys regulon transcriptional activator
MRKNYPSVTISLHQGTPVQVAQMVMDQVAEVGIATESLADYPDLVTLPCYEWQHTMILPQEHPLVEKLEAFRSVDSSLGEKLRLEDIAAYPLITYHQSFTGRSRIDAAFAAKGLHPQIVLEAIDSDVIKTYVKLGLGIGIIAEMSAPEQGEDGLACYPMGILLGRNTTRIAFKKSSYLREFTLQFAEYLSERLSRKLLLKALKNESDKDSAFEAYTI